MALADRRGLDQSIISASPAPGKTYEGDHWARSRRARATSCRPHPMSPPISRSGSLEKLGGLSVQRCCQRPDLRPSSLSVVRCLDARRTHGRGWGGRPRPRASGQAPITPTTWGTRHHGLILVRPTRRRSNADRIRPSGPQICLRHSRSAPTLSELAGALKHGASRRGRHPARRTPGFVDDSTSLVRSALCRGLASIAPLLEGTRKLARVRGGPELAHADFAGPARSDGSVFVDRAEGRPDPSRAVCLVPPCLGLDRSCSCVVLGVASSPRASLGLLPGTGLTDQKSRSSFRTCFAASLDCLHRASRVSSSRSRLHIRIGSQEVCASSPCPGPVLFRPSLVYQRRLADMLCSTPTSIS